MFITAKLRAGIDSSRDQIQKALGGPDWFMGTVGRTISDKGGWQYEKVRDKYPHLGRDELANKLVRIAAYQAMAMGGAAGGLATAAELGAIPSIGASLAAGVGSIAAEIAFVTSLQVRLVRDIAACYDRQLDPACEEDIVMVLALAIGIRGSAVANKALRSGGREAAKIAIMHAFKETFTERLANNVREYLGYQVGKRVLAKRAGYLIPGVAVVIGSGVNLWSTKAVGNVSKSFFRDGL